MSVNEMFQVVWVAFRRYRASVAAERECKREPCRSERSAAHEEPQAASKAADFNTDCRGMLWSAKSAAQVRAVLAQHKRARDT